MAGGDGVEIDRADSAAPGTATPPPDDEPELPESMREGRADPEAAERALVRKPQIGDTRPAPKSDPTPPAIARSHAARWPDRRTQADAPQPFTLWAVLAAQSRAPTAR